MKDKERLVETTISSTQTFIHPMEIIFSSGVVSLVVTLLICVLFLGKYKEKVDNHDKNLNKNNDKIDKLSDRLSSLEGGLERDRAKSEYIKSQSPLNLTEKGKALLLDSSGKDYIDSKKDDLLKEIELAHPKTAYDVQELTRSVIEKHINEDEFNKIKEFAFKKGLKLDVILDVLGIYLRDLALPKLGFKINDIKIKETK